jgi:hypothetical protein
VANILNIECEKRDPIVELIHPGAEQKDQLVAEKITGEQEKDPGLFASSLT